MWIQPSLGGSLVLRGPALFWADWLLRAGGSWQGGASPQPPQGQGRQSQPEPSLSLPLPTCKPTCGSCTCASCSLGGGAEGLSVPGQCKVPACAWLWPSMGVCVCVVGHCAAPSCCKSFCFLAGGRGLSRAEELLQGLSACHSISQSWYPLRGLPPPAARELAAV